MTGSKAKARRREHGTQGGPSPSLANEPAPSSRSGLWLAGLAIVLVTAGAYHNSLGGPFIYDDPSSILENPTIRHLWPLSTVLSPPRDTGWTVDGRPVLNLSLAVNYAISGAKVWSYHAANLLIHALAGLVLFGIVRRTLLLPPLRGRFGSAASGLAMAVALIWAVHPLQTESVTYVIQRAESLMGLFYLLTLYGLIRSAGSPRPGLWSVASVAACALGMATKEVTVTAPLIVLLYDRTFLAGSFQQAIRKRRGLYVGLAACYGLLAYLMSTAGTRGETAGLGAGGVVGWWEYARTEFGVILKYLQLSLWPDSLCLDYGWRITTHWEDMLPGAVVVAALAGAALWGLCGGRKWGFPLAWLLVILAPTSSVVPIMHPIFEHRMYLSLAGVAALAVVGVYLLWQVIWPRVAWLSGGSVVRRWALPCGALAAAVGVLAWLTILRNMDYRSEIAIWRDTANKRPTNGEAFNNLAWQLATREPSRGGDPNGAVQAAQHALQVGSAKAEWLDTLAAAYASAGRFGEAIETEEKAIELLRAAGKAPLVAEFQAHMERFRAGQPWREPAQP